MNATLQKRLARLEAMLPAELPPREWTEEDRLRSQTLQELVGRMDPAHAHHIFVDLTERGGHSNLTRAALWIVDRNLTEGTPLELPGCAAEVYLEDPDAHPLQPKSGSSR